MKGEETTILRSSSPADIAKWVIDKFFTDDEPPNSRLIHSHGADYYYFHPSGRWTVQDHSWLTNFLWGVLSEAIYEQKSDGETKVKRINPTKNLIENVVAAITAYTQISANQLPRWIGDNTHERPDPRFLIEFTDCILDVRASAEKSQYVVYEKNKAFLNTSVLSVPFLVDGKPPAWMISKAPLWEKLCKEWGQDDPQWVECRNRCYGYALIAYRGFAKWLIEYGKPRSGKGTATNVVLRSLLSDPAVYFTKVRNLADTFGLDGPDKSQTLVIGEADELTNPQEGRAVVSILKSAVGGDPVPIRVMYKRGQENKVLRCFPIMQCNEMPALPDSAQGLMSKMIPLYFGKSFAKSQDDTIPDRLQKELPQIAKCWVDACIRLVKDKGNFRTPESSKTVINSYRLANNPVEAFLEHYYEEDPDGFVPISQIRVDRRKWESDNGIWIKRNTGQRLSDQHLLPALCERSGWNLTKNRTSWVDGEGRRVQATGLSGLRPKD